MLSKCTFKVGALHHIIDIENENAKLKFRNKKKRKRQREDKHRQVALQRLIELRKSKCGGSLSESDKLLFEGKF